MQGDLERQRYGPVIMTIHNVGSSYRSMVDFINHPEMLEVKNRYIIVWDISMYSFDSQAQLLCSNIQGPNIKTNKQRLLLYKIVSGIYLARRC